jgi:UTP--glucose-1-phosphate uridylyltransferase
MVDIVEKPVPEEAPSNLAVIGRYVLHPEIFDAIRVTEPGAGDEIQLSDALKYLINNSERGVLAYTFTGTRYDAGDKIDYLRATVELAARREDIGPPFVAFLRSFLDNLDRGVGQDHHPEGLNFDAP